jgi:hypothetical protein
MQATGKMVFAKGEDFSSKDHNKYLEIGNKTSLSSTDSLVSLVFIK